MKRVIILTLFCYHFHRSFSLTCKNVTLPPDHSLVDIGSAYIPVCWTRNFWRSFKKLLSLIELPSDDRCRLNMCIGKYNIWCRWYRCFLESQPSIDKIELYAFSKRLMGANYRKTVCCLICSLLFGSGFLFFLFSFLVFSSCWVFSVGEGGGGVRGGWMVVWVGVRLLVFCVIYPYIDEQFHCKQSNGPIYVIQQH